jgi:3-hydroxybutyrate dehydrogenase
LEFHSWKGRVKKRGVNLLDKVSRNVFITGGSGSVGRALIEAFCRSGDKVTFQYNSNQALAEKLNKEYGAEPLCIDFLQSFSIPAIDFDVLINNAGVNISDAVSHDVTLDDWNLTLLFNVTIPFQLTKLCLPSMMQKQWGRIINISSIYGLRGVEKNLPYTVSKHALSGLTKTIAKEYAIYGITCNEICPGPIDSDMMQRIGNREAQAEGISLDDYFKSICDEIPIGRMAKPREIASLSIYLASDNADYLNGVSIPLDGGLIA